MPNDCDHGSEAMGKAERCPRCSSDFPQGASPRARLVDAITRGVPHSQVEKLADLAHWPLPQQFTVAAADLRAVEVVARRLGQKYLLRVDGHRMTVIGDAEQVSAMVERLADSQRVIRVARSWPVWLSDVRNACRWTNRALTLARVNVIPDAPIIDCADHRPTLALHSEPGLQAALATDLLAPILKQTRARRSKMAAMLLVWLQSRGSAPVMAAMLGVHERTVRMRMKLVREVVGEVVDDPSQTLPLLMALEARPDLWRDQLSAARSGD